MYIGHTMKNTPRTITHASTCVATTTWTTTGPMVGDVEVIFRNGGRYVYSGVPLWVYGAWFMPGTSSGRFYRSEIWGKFECKEIVDEPKDLRPVLLRSLARGRFWALAKAADALEQTPELHDFVVWTVNPRQWTLTAVGADGERGPVCGLPRNRIQLAEAMGLATALNGGIEVAAAA